MKHKIYTILKKNNIFLVFFIYSLIHLYNVQFIGTYWDDLGYINTSQIIIDKVKLYFTDFNNLFLGEFNYNFEFYGFLIPLIIFLLTKVEFLNELLISFLNYFFGYEPLTKLDQQNTLRFLYFYICMLAVLILILKKYTKITNKQNSFFFLILLLLTPTFNGHLFFNLKDVPFALIYFLSCIFVFDNKNLLTKNFKSNLRSNLILSILFSSLLLIRFSGVIFIGFLLFNYFLLNKIRINFKYFINLIFVGLISLSLFFLLTPSAWRYPLKWVRGAIETQFFLEWGGIVLTNGEFLSATNLPFNYLFTWFFYQLPWPYILLFFYGFYLFLRKYNNIDVFSQFSIIFISTILIFFSITTPVTYDGVRQYLFLIPFIIHIITISFSSLFNHGKNKIFINIFLILFFSLMVYTQYSLYPFTYTYYNELVEEDKITIDCEKIGGCGYWETDYWGVSGKEIVSNTKDIINEDYGVLSCTPSQVFTDYYISKNTIDSRHPLYIYTIHRPEIENGLCENILIETDNCETIYTEKRKLRNEFINLSYLLECNFNR